MQRIAGQIEAGERVSSEDGVFLDREADVLELGRLALSRGRLDEADGLAAAALAIAKPRDHALVTFRAEWLRHAVQRHRDPADPDRHRLAYLKKLYTRIDEHGGVEEVREFKRRYCTPSGARGGSS